MASPDKLEGTLTATANLFVLCEKAGPSLKVPAHFEVAFSAVDIPSLTSPGTTLSAKYAAHFAHAISRCPSDLKAHVNRIRLHHRDREEDSLYSALLDLFIALEAKGFDLRKRLLMGSRTKLSAAHFAALENALDQALLEQHLPLGRSSVLSKGLTGELPIVFEAAASDNDETRDPLLEAREYIEYFQLDQARVLLENAILANPLRADLQHELLTIYRATGDQKHWQAMREKLMRLADPMPAEWASLTGDETSQVIS